MFFFNFCVLKIWRFLLMKVMVWIDTVECFPEKGKSLTELSVGLSWPQDTLKPFILFLKKMFNSQNKLLLFSTAYIASCFSSLHCKTRFLRPPKGLTPVSSTFRHYSVNITNYFFCYVTVRVHRLNYHCFKILTVSQRSSFSLFDGLSDVISWSIFHNTLIYVWTCESINTCAIPTKKGFMFIR